ncbi:hypothetical protein RYH80_13090 [Halobaculum sp. MBLA0147]|uniref:hypothetical protein n=1 Tax=Halobaculum sp. MBLA0147 TaxID=3079934 RepID=UPI0035246887
MGEITVSGEDVEAVGELAEELRLASRFTENDLFDAFTKVVDVMDAIEELSAEQGTARKSEVEERAKYESVGTELRLLEQHGFVEVDDKSWRYVGE